MTGLDQSVEKMRADGVADAAIATFGELYERLVAGESGLMAEADIEPVTELPDADELAGDPGDFAAVLDQAVVLKLNGGLGTSMGLDGPKSLLEVKDGLTFLDITARQLLSLRERTGARLPLVLMNSFSTREPSLERLSRYPDLAVDVPLDFLQNKEPKLLADGFAPVSWPADPALEWAPPGHGDLYPALVSSGMLAALLEQGYRYAFVANADNLGAVLDPRILGWMAAERIPFLMEVADRTGADRKGGHLARRAGAGAAAGPGAGAAAGRGAAGAGVAGGAAGGLVLREIAQTPDADLAAFQDIARHRYFNTNNLWLDLQALDAALRERDGVLALPMIVNRKTVDPRDPDSPAVIQLETAMGAAIAVFDGAQALRVSRRRFAPVKTTNDLLALRSDAYVVDEHFEVTLRPERTGPPLIDLDGAHFRRLADFEAHFPAGPPSLAGCDRLDVVGDVHFGADVVIRGSVRITDDADTPKTIPDGALLEG